MSMMLAILCGFTVTLLTAPAASAATGGKLRTFTYQLEPNEVAKKALRNLRVVRVGDPNPAATPIVPPPSCDISDVSATITSTYIDDVLQTTDTAYSSSVTCARTAANQTMGFLSDVADVYVDNAKRQQGSVDECQYPNPQNEACLQVLSVGEYLCAGEFNCDGNYQIISLPDLLLPAGFIWASWDPDVCSELAPSELLCHWGTNVVTIPAVR